MTRAERKAAYAVRVEDLKNKLDADLREQIEGYDCEKERKRIIETWITALRDGGYRHYVKPGEEKLFADAMTELVNHVVPFTWDRR